MDDLRKAAIEAEAALGENLTWLTDQLDLQIRQKDAETLRKLAQMTVAWGALVRALHGVAAVDKMTAVRRLTARWNEQVERFPTMRQTIPLELYIERNLGQVMRDGLLASYDKAG